MEFALGTNPLLANASPLTADWTQLPDGSHLRLTVPKNPTAINLSFVVEVSPDLDPSSWTSAQTTVKNETANKLRVRDSLTVSASSRRFIRLRVNSTP